MFGYYGSLATEVYDIDKPIGTSFGDVEFYLELLKGCKGRVLEPCVGTGRILIPLLQQGIDVEGFDCSDDMLGLCQNHCKERGLSPKLFNDKMEELNLDNRYEAIIIPTGSFLLLHNREDSLEALSRFYHHLESDGRLIVDIALQNDFKENTSVTRCWNSGMNEMITLEQKFISIDYINQYTVSYLRYEKWRDKKLITTELESFSMRWYGIEEFKLILENIGFRDIVISSDYKHGVYPNNNTETITFEAYKRTV